MNASVHGAVDLSGETISAQEVQQCLFLSRPESFRVEGKPRVGRIFNGVVRGIHIPEATCT